MDKSPKYVAMCAKAAEIQNRWRPDHGDFYQTENGQIKCWLTHSRQPQRFKKGVGIFVETGGLIQLTRYIWLPRQDQLIELSQIPGRRYENIVQDFFDWTKASYGETESLPGRLFRSMEQIWLAYVMQKKFARLWDESRWTGIIELIG